MCASTADRTSSRNSRGAWFFFFDFLLVLPHLLEKTHSWRHCFIICKINIVQHCDVLETEIVLKRETHTQNWVNIGENLFLGKLLTGGIRDFWFFTRSFFWARFWSKAPLNSRFYLYFKFMLKNDQKIIQIHVHVRALFGFLNVKPWKKKPVFLTLCCCLI